MKWKEVDKARAAAHAKHGANSIERMEEWNEAWLPVLMEEVGEVAHYMTYDARHPKGTLHGRREELIDIMSVCSAWVDAIDRRLMRD